MVAGLRGSALGLVRLVDSGGKPNPTPNPSPNPNPTLTPNPNPKLHPTQGAPLPVEELRRRFLGTLTRLAELEAAERKRLEASRAEACEQRMLGNFEAADRWTAEYEQRAARGPTIVEVEEPAAPSYTPEEFAELQAAAEADRADCERKRQAAEGLLFHNQRRRNN